MTSAAAYLTFVSMLMSVACVRSQGDQVGGRAGNRGAANGGAGAGTGTQKSSFAVEWAGCAGVRSGPVCDLGTDRKVTVWMIGADRARGWTVTTAGAGIGAAAGATEMRRLVNHLPLDGGTQVTLAVPTGADTLQLVDASGIPLWSLRVATGRDQRQIDDLVAFGRTGKYQDALGKLEELRASASAPDRGPADAGIGRMALALGRVDRAEPAFRAAIAAAFAEGRLGDVVKDSAALLWALAHLQQRYADARALLAEMRPAAVQYPEGQVWLDFHTGLLAADTADIRTALESYRRAGRGARRLGLTGLAQNASMEVARLLTRIGRSDEAIRLLREVPTPADSCARASHILNLVWALMQRQGSGASLLTDDAGETAAQVLAARQATDACPDPHRRTLALLYAAEDALNRQDDGAAEQLIHQLGAMRDGGDVLRASQRADLTGRWFLRRKQNGAALAAFDSQLPPIRARALLDEEFRAQTGAGRALLALGRRKEAVSRLRGAQQILETMLRGVPLGEGRGSFLSGRDEGVRYLVAALVEGGAVAEALRAARLARAAEVTHAAQLHRLAGMAAPLRKQWDETLQRYQQLRTDGERDAQEDWKIPKAELVALRASRQAQAEQARAALDDAYRLITAGQGPTDAVLPQPRPGELYLAIFPGPTEWFVFAANSTAVVTNKVSEANLASAASAAPVLALVDRQIASARRVRVLAYGAADRIDWQAVTWRGKPLVQSREVEYGLDVTSARPEGGPSAKPPLALVVSNPTQDLPLASSEAEGAAGALGGWRVTRLDGATATREAVRAALPGARLFHYAGHAQLSPFDGLSSALLLNGDSRLELGDLLALPSVPDFVILPACEAAAAVEGGRSAMGLAQAFVLAGARVAVAPVRAVRDSDAATFVRSFYTAFVRATACHATNSADLDAVSADCGHAAFRAGTLAFLAQRGEVGGPKHPAENGWEAFRLYVP